MAVTTRQLTPKDFDLYQSMETGLEEDYMLRVFNRISQGDNALFGLFEDETLVAVAGYTVFAQEYVMLGRLRSDRRYRNMGYGTRIIQYVIDQALANPSVEWICANTEQHNTPALTVLKKLNIPPIESLYAAQATDVSRLGSDKQVWSEVKDLAIKKEWINQTYLNPSFEASIFPFEAYYPFPIGDSLFEDRLSDWRLFENAERTRYLLMWEEKKGDDLLHVVYPWNDLVEQAGLFETIQSEFDKAKDKGTASVIWMDLTEEDAASLPDSHPFDLPSPWILHGLSREELEIQMVERSISEARSLIYTIEEELKSLDSNLEKEAQDVHSLLSANEQVISNIIKAEQEED